ncbi:MAG: sulfotransferase domain-containing protein [Armatimonadota bacterium]|jgi:hypothetical protein
MNVSAASEGPAGQTQGTTTHDQQRPPLWRRLCPPWLARSVKMRAYFALGLGDPDYDAFVIGYPKVGNTWFQVMLRKLLVSHSGLDDSFIPKIFAPRRHLPANTVAVEITHAMPGLDTESWQEMTIAFPRFRRKKVMLLIREPKDTMVSYYMQNRFRENPPLFEGTIEEMIHDEVLGLDKYLAFYRAWAESGREIADVHLIRYEAMHADAHEVLRRTASFLGLEGVAESSIREAVEFGSFDNMRKLEDRDALGMYALSRPHSPDNRARKVRRGRIGGYSEELTDELAEYIDRRVRADLPEFYGYPLQ